MTITRRLTDMGAKRNTSKPFKRRTREIGMLSTSRWLGKETDRA